MSPGHWSDPDWLACSDCAACIEHNDWKGLLGRAEASYRTRQDGEMPEQIRTGPNRMHRSLRRNIRRAKKPVRAIESAAQITEIRALIKKWETAKRPGPRVTDDLFLFVTLLCVTGVRPGELLAVRWFEVNLVSERPYLEITGTVKQEPGLGICRQEYPKFPTSVRRVELHRRP